MLNKTCSVLLPWQIHLPKDEHTWKAGFVLRSLRILGSTLEVAAWGEAALAAGSYSAPLFFLPLASFFSVKGFACLGVDTPACMGKLCPHPLPTATSGLPPGGRTQEVGWGATEQGSPWSQIRDRAGSVPSVSRISHPMRKGTVRKEPECHPLDWDSGLRALLWTLGGGC